jgi:polysaccharide export outer membrane protein
MNHIFRLMLGALLLATAPAAAQTDYTIGAQDVLTITVYNQEDLSGKFTVDADGTLTFPLIGRVKAGGLTLRGLEEDLRKRLADGYLRTPQVSVSMEQYRSQRIFVMGEVRSPGAYQLTGDMTIIEAIARAGSTTPQAADEVMIVRPREGKAADGPILATDDHSEVIRINLREIQEGALSKNVQLLDGDTLVVQKARSVYVFGQVRAPGAYPVDKDTTVLQALSLAGGVTDRGSTGRIKIVRTVDGKKKELKVKLTDIVEPGDTVIVAERFF